MPPVAQGGQALLRLLAENSAGQPIDAVNLTLTLRGPLPASTTVLGPLAVPPVVHDSLGDYHYVWAVGGAQAIGSYEAVWDGLILGDAVETIELIEVVAPGSLVVPGDYSYDLTTDVGLVRMNIDDRDVTMVDPSIPINERSAIFSDPEIQSALDDRTVGGDVNLASARLLLVIANNRKLLVQSRRIGRKTVDYGNVRSDLMRQAQAFVQLAQSTPADGVAEIAYDDFSARQIVLNSWLRGG